MVPSKPHLLDLKIPLGGLLSFYGLLLTVYGLTTDSAMNEKSLGININLYGGIVMLVMGGIFVAVHLLKARK